MNLTGFICLTFALAGPAAATPESRALAYLAREVPRWSAENKCFSCHNNGDGARALYTAVRLSFPVPPQALADTTDWLARPAQWDHNGGDSSASDKDLARIQFAAALVEALDASALKDRAPLRRAAKLIAERQHADGSWKAGAEGAVGSPATHGTALATYHARRVLDRADPKEYRAAIARADDWFRRVKLTSVLDAAAVLLGLEGSADDGAASQRRTCFALLQKGQACDGGWGPYVNSPPEPFDTAVVLLALSRCVDRKVAPEMIRRGRTFLIGLQEKDGSWRETTRPPGAESYAQRLSTTGWATLALLATRARSARSR
jgi:squalene cyclase